ncbi:unnamed protein product [Linum trigynum]|uniref:Uncharacterized protein n=1 Tax=Linum trigynum TaxID=586398 RepID=A0AAV2FLA8_9ROSI
MRSPPSSPIPPTDDHRRIHLDRLVIRGGRVLERLINREPHPFHIVLHKRAHQSSDPILFAFKNHPITRSPDLPADGHYCQKQHRLID